MSSAVFAIMRARYERVQRIFRFGARVSATRTHERDRHRRRWQPSVLRGHAARNDRNGMDNASDSPHRARFSPSDLASPPYPVAWSPLAVGRQRAADLSWAAAQPFRRALYHWLEA